MLPCRFTLCPVYSSHVPTDPFIPPSLMSSHVSMEQAVHWHTDGPQRSSDEPAGELCARRCGAFLTPATWTALPGFTRLPALGRYRGTCTGYHSGDLHCSAYYRVWLETSSVVGSYTSGVKELAEKHVHTSPRYSPAPRSPPRANLMAVRRYGPWKVVTAAWQASTLSTTLAGSGGDESGRVPQAATLS